MSPINAVRDCEFFINIEEFINKLDEILFKDSKIKEFYVWNPHVNPYGFDTIWVNDL